VAAGGEQVLALRMGIKRTDGVAIGFKLAGLQRLVYNVVN
jgi:hypothetical protein